MLVRWRNLDWVSEVDRAAIERQLELWSEDGCAVDRVELHGCAPAPRSSDDGASSERPARTRISARVGTTQVTVVRAAATREESLREALLALEESAKWTAARACDSPHHSARTAEVPARQPSGVPTSGDDRARWPRLEKLHQLSLPRLSIPSPSLPSLPRRAATPLPAAAPSATAARPVRRSGRATGSRGRRGARRRASTSKARRSNKAAQRRARGKRGLPLRSLVLVFTVAGLIALDPAGLSLLRVRAIGDLLDRQRAPDVPIFAATAIPLPPGGLVAIAQPLDREPRGVDSLRALPAVASGGVVRAAPVEAPRRDVPSQALPALRRDPAPPADRSPPWAIAERWGVHTSATPHYVAVSLGLP
jgi:hypothetical protein